MKRIEREPDTFRCACAPLGCNGVIPGPRVGGTIVGYCPNGCPFGICQIHAAAPVARGVAGVK